MTPLRLFLAALLTVALGVPPDAQPRRDQHRIVVTSDGGQCSYEIADQNDPLTFVISPRGTVRFQTRGGLKVTASILPTEGGVSGTDGGNALSIDWGEQSRQLIAREALGRETEHEVRIHCCMDRQGDTCERWQRAQPVGDDLGARLVPGADGAASGPAAGEPSADPAKVADGPRMKVDE